MTGSWGVGMTGGVEVGGGGRGWGRGGGGGGKSNIATDKVDGHKNMNLLMLITFI